MGDGNSTVDKKSTSLIWLEIFHLIDFKIQSIAEVSISGVSVPTLVRVFKRYVVLRTAVARISYFCPLIFYQI